MSVVTSPQFASAAAEGADWRDASKKVLQELEKAKTPGTHFNFGFLYISDHLVGEASGILNLFKSVLKIDDWIGTVGLGVCGNGESFIDKPAVAAMIGTFKPEDFCIFSGDATGVPAALTNWLEQKDPMLVFLHADPLAEEDPARTIKNLEQITGGFLSGGLSSSRSEHIQFAGELLRGGACGAVFSQNIPVASTLSQGCTPVGPSHTITRSDDHIIHELDSEQAVSVFENDLRKMAMQKIERNPDMVLIEGGGVQNVPDEFRSLFKGEVHAAFPVPESDRNDYLVRNIIGLDPDDGSMMIAQNVSNGESVIFVHRDDHTVQEDLSKSLLALRKRIEKENNGTFAPKGALYISCVARAFSRFGGKETQNDEMKLIRDIIGDVPLAGFYAGGEISNARLYGYTGILTLFL